MADRAVLISLGTKLGNTAALGTLGAGVNRLANMARNVFAGVVAYKGIGLLKDAFDSVTASAQEQQDAVNNLTASLRIAGFEAEGLTLASQQLASELQKQTRYGDEAILKMQSLLVTYGVMPSKLEEATRATLDFAAATGRDLETAALTVGKAAAGFTGELSRYGIIVDTQGIPKTEVFAKVLAKLQEQFGGRAVADAKTYAGQLAQLGNVWDDLKEQVGGFVVDSGGAVSVMDTLKGIIQEASGYLEQYGPIIREAVNEGLARAVDWIKQFYSDTRQWVEQGGLIEVFQRLHSMFDALVGLGRMFWGTIKLVGAGIWEMVAGVTWLLEKIGAVEEGMAKAIADQAQAVADSARESLEKGWKNLTEDALDALGSKQQAIADQQAVAADAAARKARDQADAEAKIMAAREAALRREAELAKRLTDEEAKRAGEMAKQYGMMSALERAQVRTVLERLQAGGQSAFEGLGGKEMELVGRSRILQDYVERQGFDRRLAEKELGADFAKRTFGKVDVQATLKNEITAKLEVDGPSIAQQITERVLPRIMELLNSTVGVFTGRIGLMQSSGQAVAGAAAQ